MAIYRKIFLKAGFTGIANSSLSAVVALTIAPLVIFNVGMANYGVWVLLAAFGPPAGLALLGVNKGIAHFVPAEEHAASRHEVFTCGLVVFSGAIAILCALSAMLVWSDFDPWGSQQSVSSLTRQAIVYLGFALLALTMLAQIFHAVFEAELLQHRSNLWSLWLTVSHYVALYVASIFASEGALMLMITTVAVNVAVTAAMGWQIFGRHGYRIRLPSRQRFRTVARYSLGALSIPVCSMSVDLIMRFLFIPAGGSFAMLGVLDLALRMGSAAQNLVSSFAVPVFSIVSGQGASNPAENRRLVTGITLKLAGLWIAGVAVFWLLEPVFPLIFDQHSRILFDVALLCVAAGGVVGVAEAPLRALMALKRLALCFWVILALPIIFGVAFFALSGMPAIWQFSIARSVAVSADAFLFIVTYLIVVRGAGAAPVTRP